MGFVSCVRSLLISRACIFDCMWCPQWLLPGVGEGGRCAAAVAHAPGGDVPGEAQYCAYCAAPLVVKGKGDEDMELEEMVDLLVPE